MTVYVLLRQRKWTTPELFTSDIMGTFSSTEKAEERKAVCERLSPPRVGAEHTWHVIPQVLDEKDCVTVG